MSNSTPESLFESHLELAAKIGSNFPMANASTDECVQEARIALWTAAQAFDPSKGEFTPFASTVIRNHLRNAYNKAKRRSVEVTTLDIAIGGDEDSASKTLKEIIPSAEASPLLEAERVDVRANIRAGLDALTPSQREVMESFAGGKTYADIARDKGVSKAAVRQMAERAADQMRPQLRVSGSLNFMPETYSQMQETYSESRKPLQPTPPLEKSITTFVVVILVIMGLVALILLTALFSAM